MNSPNLPTPLPTTLAPSVPTHPQPQPTSSLADDIVQDVLWLWPQRLPLGKLTLLEGSPGSGTSLFAISLAACVSTGSAWPDGTPCPPGNVLLVAPHDSAHDTIPLRLHAAGADTNHIFFFSRFTNPTPSAPRRVRPLALPEDLALLEKNLLRRQIRLLILDPFSALPGLGQCLLDLVHLAEHTNCAILLAAALRQPPANPLHPCLPSSAVRTVARSCLLLAPDPADERKHLLLTTKHSLCPPSDTLSYEISTTQDGIPFLHWLGQTSSSHLDRLSTAPLRSPHRQAILRFLHASPTVRTFKDIIEATSYDQEAGRKMIMRMRMAGELVSPARGLYTTAGHPCLTSSPTPSIAPPVPNVPNVPSLNPSTNPAPLEPPSPSTTSNSSTSSVPNVPNVPDPSGSASQGKEDLSPADTSPVPNVPNVSNPPDSGSQGKEGLSPTDTSSVPNVPNVPNPSGCRSEEREGTSVPTDDTIVAMLKTVESWLSSFG